MERSFEIRSVSLEPGRSLPYDAAQWRDALVVVRRGEIVLEAVCGRLWFFVRGDILWFDGLPLASLRNRGEERVVLWAASRNPEMP